MTPTALPDAPKPAWRETSWTSWRTVLNLVTRLVLAYAVLTITVPFLPSVPVIALDPSWAEAMNRAVDAHMVFGRDIVFTYGPYAGVTSWMYDPHLRHITLLASALYAAGWILSTQLLMRRTPWWVRLGVALLILMGICSAVYNILVLYPLAAVVATRLLLESGATRRPLRYAALAVLSAPLGLLPLIKLSTLPAAPPAALVIAFLLWRARERLAAGLCLAVPALVAIVGWVGIGQPLLALPRYVVADLPIVSGYSGAMNTPEFTQLPVGLTPMVYVVCAILFGVVALLATRRRWDRLAEWLMLVLTLFLSFKATFLRPDAHMQGSAIALLLTGGVIAGLLTRWWARIGISVIACAAAGTVFMSALGQSVDAMFTVLHSNAITLPEEVVRGHAANSYLRHSYQRAHAAIRSQGTVPPVSGTVDLYSYLQSELFAEPHVAWRPRPVIQSYSAYTAGLADLNAKHLTSSAAPHTLLVQIQPIDDRLAALDDGHSWLAMLERYNLESFNPATNYLELSQAATPRHFRVGPPDNVRAKVGSWVSVPRDQSGWLANFDVQPTLLGSLRTTLWAPPLMSIDIRTADHHVYTARFVPAMAKASFLISPLIRDSAGLGSLFMGQGWERPREVRAIRLTYDSRGSRFFWKSSFGVQLHPVWIPRGAPLSAAQVMPQAGQTVTAPAGTQ